MSKKLIRCDTHGRTTGYAICKCILEQGKPVRAVTEPDPKATGISRTIGSIVCFDKHPDDHGVDDIVLLCKQCADKLGYTKPRETN